jgi:3-dehydroquinate synthase
LLIDADETAKTVVRLPGILAPIVRAGFTKKDRIVAVGGGVIQDIAGFVASVLYRGVDWVYYPTTLLSQADSCIGGKTSLNFEGYKNLVGSFYPPAQVIIDREFLLTLHWRETLSGLCEMAHFFFLHSPADFVAFAESHGAAIHSPDILDTLARRSLHIKRIYIERDEFDRRVRRVLNYGHSFGHAIEAHEELPHGIAVAWGMEIANRVSLALDHLDEETYHDMALVLDELLKDEMISINTDAMMRALKRDKKNTGADTLNLILTQGPGRMFESVVETACIEELLHSWARAEQHDERACFYREEKR